METRDAQYPRMDIEAWNDACMHAAHRRHTDADNIQILVYENEVPPFLGPVLDGLYQSLYSSLSHLDVYGGLRDANAYVAVKERRILAALIFRQAPHEVTVVNEAFRIGKDELGRFAAYIFRTYPSVRKISLNAVSTESHKLGHAVQHFPGTTYTIVPLPATEKQYLDKLGKSTRKTIQYRLNRLKRAFPSFRHEVQAGDAISGPDLLAVIEFNKRRMAEKSKIVHLDQEEIARVAAVARRSGFLSLIRIDGRVCAGTILYQTGNTVTSHVNAHDPDYNEYRLGTLSCYLAICESIRRGAKEFNLEWGGEEYKYGFLGVDHAFDKLMIYRSYLHLLSDSRTILQIRTDNRVQAAKAWLFAQSKKDNHFAKLLNSSIALAKRKKYSDWMQQNEQA